MESFSKVKNKYHNKDRKKSYGSQYSAVELQIFVNLCFFSPSSMESTCGMLTSSRRGWSSGSSVTQSPFWHSTILTCFNWATTPAQGKEQTDWGTDRWINFTVFPTGS